MISSRKKYVLFISFSLLIFLTGCGPKALFDDTKSIPDGVWMDEQLLRFEVPVNDTLNLHMFYLNIRHTTNYRYANLFLFISTTFPDGETARDTVECILADRSGKWLGKGISNMRDNQVLLRRGLRFPQKGKYVFELEQAMREPELEEVMDVGFRIVRE
ncbi:MAG: gliding motility lipoprotein GldH [Bacteroidales bacterium]|nr:gliding motility lipoprotein GldH [Bacteroidales bacterium]